MPEGAAVVELHSLVHSVFDQVCSSVGVEHVAATDAEHAALYRGGDEQTKRLFIELDTRQLVRLVRRVWERAARRVAETS